MHVSRSSVGLLWPIKIKKNVLLIDNEDHLFHLLTYRYHSLPNLAKIPTFLMSRNKKIY